MSDVFISHSSQDKETAQSICEYLEQHGLTCWIAPRDIVPGSDWAASISTAITASKVFLLIYSKNSSVSDQVAREIGIAEKKDGVFVVPYRADDAPLVGAYEYYLTSSHWIVADPANGNMKFEELYNIVAGLTGKAVQNITNNTYIDNLHIHGSNITKEDIANGVDAAVKAVSPQAMFSSASVSSPVDEFSAYPDFAAAVPAAAGASPAKKSSKKLLIALAAAAVIAIVVTIVLLLGGSSEKTEKLKDITINYTGNDFIGTYKGETDDGVPNGKGKFVGNWDDDEYQREMIYEGEFKNGTLTGEAELTITRSDGKEIYFSGEFSNGYLNGSGKGKVITPDGDIHEYEGEYANSEYNGTGTKTITYKSDELYSSSTYSGEFQNNKYQGNGKLTFICKEGNDRELIDITIQGEFKAGNADGKCTAESRYTDGEVFFFTGDYKSGSPYNGTTIGRDKDGNIVRTLNYINGVAKEE